MVTLTPKVTEADTNINFNFAEMLPGTGECKCAPGPTCDCYDYRCADIISRVHRFFQLELYPNAQQLLAGEIPFPDDLLAPNITGRVTPLGNFYNFTQAFEYLFGFSGNPAYKYTAYNITDIFCSGNELYIRAVFTLEANQFIYGTFYEVYTGRYKFNDENLSEYVEAYIPDLGKLFVIPPAEQPDVTLELCEAVVATGLCNSINDPTGYYTDVNDCVAFMNSIDFGTFYQLSCDCVVCRIFHAVLAQYDPTAHCPHVGKTGGGKCIDTPYTQYLGDF